MSTFSDIWPKLTRSKKYREEFVAAHAKQAIPFQIRALMKQLGLSQKELAARSGLTQGVVSRAADPDYGNLTINTLVRIAAGFDVAFVGRFVPFSELPPWFDHLHQEGRFHVPTFQEESATYHAREAAAQIPLADAAMGMQPPDEGVETLPLAVQSQVADLVVTFRFQEHPTRDPIEKHNIESLRPRQNMVERELSPAAA